MQPAGLPGHVPGEMKKVLHSFLSRVTSRISRVMLTILPATGGTRRKSRILREGHRGVLSVPVAAPGGTEGICLSLPRAQVSTWSAEDSALSPAWVSSRWCSRGLGRGDPLDPVADPKARTTSCPWGH